MATEVQAISTSLMKSIASIAEPPPWTNLSHCPATVARENHYSKLYCTKDHAGWPREGPLHRLKGRSSILVANSCSLPTSTSIRKVCHSGQTLLVQKWMSRLIIVLLYTLPMVSLWWYTSRKYKSTGEQSTTATPDMELKHKTQEEDQQQTSEETE